MHLAAKLALAGSLPISLLAGKTWLGSGCPSACEGPTVAAQSGVDPAVTGRYVEARSASVYAGACHYGAEYTTQGREAVLAWELDGGSLDGVPLAGVDVVAVVSAEGNLAEPGVTRSSVVYLDQELPPAVQAAALAWLEREHGAALGTVRKVKRVEVAVDCGERYSVRVADLVLLEGQAMPDRACCSMPSNVWYRPLVELDGRLVGESALFQVRDPDVGPAFVRRAENDAFLGTIPAPAGAPCPDAAGACAPRVQGACCPSEQPSARP